MSLSSIVLSRWDELLWCQDATASWAFDWLVQHFGRFGSPSLIRSDRSSHFANDLIKDFLDRTAPPPTSHWHTPNKRMPSSRESTLRSTAISARSSLTLSTLPVTAQISHLSNASSMRPYTRVRESPQPVSCLATGSLWTRAFSSPPGSPHCPHPSVDKSRRCDPHPGITYDASCHSFAYR
jgi:hypothetical protein